GRPRKPQVPLIVWTSRKILSRIFALFGSCSKRTSSTSTTSRLSFVSVRNSLRRSSMEQAFVAGTGASHAAPFSEQPTLLRNGLILVAAGPDRSAFPSNFAAMRRGLIHAEAAGGPSRRQPLTTRGVGFI